jgi:type II secretory pathway component GspD/PulD (secretin)
MRKAVTGMAILLWASLQSGRAETVVTAQDYAVDSDVVLESAVREIKSAPRDTVNVIGDAVKMVSDETVTAAKGVAAVFKADPVAKDEKTALLETASAWNSANDIVFRSYKVSEAVGSELTTGKEVVPGTTVDVSGFFTGIDFPKGASVMYRPEFKRLFVRQTLSNMLAIEDVLAEQSNAKRELMGKQVEIQTKFIEVSQSTLNELGFNWRFDSKDGGDAHIFENLTLPAGQEIMASGLRTAATAIGTGADPGALLVQKTAGSLQWSLIVTALEQSDDADVLSAPSITTRDGKTANIWVGEQRMVPKSFSAKSGNTSVYVENSDWESELMGVQLEVTPELRTGGLIDLELSPKVIDLIGYDTYQVTPGGIYGPNHDSASMMVWARSSASAMTLPTLAPVNFGNPGANTPGTDTLGQIVQSPVQAILAPILHIPGTVDTYWNKLYTTFLNTGMSPADASNAASRVNSDQRRKMEHDEYGIPVPVLQGELPYFRLREMKTQVTVADGSTVGMGGLIYDKLETYKDKVPVLGSIPLIGRLFRSEGEKSVKRNLMIFVTATEVDVNGRRSADLAMKK